MSKSLFVFDTPESCDKCHLFTGVYTDMTCNANGITIDYPYPKDFKQDWCPLKEVPQKKDIRNANTMTDLGWIEGWNACIDEVLKNCEEKKGETAMTHTLTIPTQVQLEEYYVLRAIKGTGDKKTVIAEKEFEEEPTLTDIAQFLVDSGADFASKVVNYRIGGEIPFV